MAKGAPGRGKAGSPAGSAFTDAPTLAEFRFFGDDKALILEASATEGLSVAEVVLTLVRVGYLVTKNQGA